MNKFGIYAWPAYSTRTLNPYNYLIYKHIEELGYPVHDLYFNKLLELAKVALSRDVKVVHLHWPTRIVLNKSSRLRAYQRIIQFHIFIKVCKLFRKKIFWTVHNLEEHETTHDRLQRFMNRILYSNVDGFITLNETGMHLIREKLNAPSKQKIWFIPHPHYKYYYKNNRSGEDARKKLGLPPFGFVFLFFGQIRNYKNVPQLIRAFKGLNNSDTYLLIAGKAGKTMVGREIEQMIANEKNILFKDAFIEESQVQDYLNAADLVVTPYTRIFNSGSVFLNLSFCKPTLAPDFFALSELKEILGPQWIKTYTGELTAEHLQISMNEVREEKTHETAPNLKRYSPRTIARRTVSFYQSLLKSNANGVN
jgi:glycosyltransferase involved in cell wall biosynthesis